MRRKIISLSLLVGLMGGLPAVASAQSDLSTQVQDSPSTTLASVDDSAQDDLHRPIVNDAADLGFDGETKWLLTGLGALTLFAGFLARIPDKVQPEKLPR